MSDKPFTPTVNKNVPQMGEPVADLGSLLTVVKSIKQGLESLGGYRGDMVGRAVTFNDLVGLGLVPPTTFNLPSGTGTGGVASVVNLEQETAARKAADTAEATTREMQDSLLSGAINIEATTRAAADTTEATARAAADTAEANVRAAADSALQGEIDTEETARATADVDLQNQINALAVPVVTFAGLPAGVVGRDAVVTDSTVNTWGAAVTTGGGALRVKVWWTGTAWTVLGRA